MIETVKCKDLARLRNEYEGMAPQAELQARKGGAGAAAWKGQAGAYRGVAADLNDMIEGRGHPSARRG